MNESDALVIVRAYLKMCPNMNAERLAKEMFSISCEPPMDGGIFLFIVLSVFILMFLIIVWCDSCDRERRRVAQV